MELSAAVTPTTSVTLGPRDTLLTDRAAALLTTGPATSQTVVREVCQLASVPLALADHLAVALLAADGRFARQGDGAWILSPVIPAIKSSLRKAGL